jgi:hypothetical protein
MNFGGGADPTIQACLVKGGGRVRYDEGVKPEIAGHAPCRRKAVVRGETDDHQGPGPGLTQVSLKGRADEGAVDGLPIECPSSEFLRRQAV